MEKWRVLWPSPKNIWVITHNPSNMKVREAWVPMLHGGIRHVIIQVLESWSILLDELVKDIRFFAKLWRQWELLVKFCYLNVDLFKWLFTRWWLQTFSSLTYLLEKVSILNNLRWIGSTTNQFTSSTIWFSQLFAFLNFLLFFRFV